jgi:branched-chain amino acid transport system permease protein
MASQRPARWQFAALLVILAMLLALPSLLEALDQAYYTGFATRVLIFALAASSLNLVLGFGGMVSLGHAAFFGVGAYVAAICYDAGISEGLLVLPLAMAVAGLFALAVGAISLRTRGVYFIMITLAFAQMLYYLMVSLKAYGGDDGLPLPGRAQVGLGLDLNQDTHFYYAVLAVCVLAFLAVHRLVNARFGHVLQASRDNPIRMQALGYAVHRFQLAAFALAGALAGLAGALLANQGGFVSPSMMQWSQSGMLMVMVILGGVGRLYGGLAGAVLFLVAEEVLMGYTIHWQLGLGAVLLAVVLRAPNGLLSLVGGKK